MLTELSVDDNLLIIKDYLGNAFIPGLFFNGIGEMKPGQGYQLKVNEPAVLQFLSNLEEYEQLFEAD